MGGKQSPREDEMGPLVELGNYLSRKFEDRYSCDNPDEDNQSAGRI
jgi:hypothetical protein